MDVNLTELRKEAEYQESGCMGVTGTDLLEILDRLKKLEAVAKAARALLKAPRCHPAGGWAAAEALAATLIALES